MPKIKPYTIGYWMCKNDSYNTFKENVLALNPTQAKEQVLRIHPSAKLLTTL